MSSQFVTIPCSMGYFRVRIPEGEMEFNIIEFHFTEIVIHTSIKCSAYSELPEKHCKTSSVLILFSDIL